MAKITTILSNTTEVVHNNTQGLNDGDYIHLTQLEKDKFDAIQDITQYTNELAQDAIGSILTDSSTIDITYDDVTPTISAIIKPNSIGSTELSNSINISEFVNDSNYETTSQLNIRDDNNRDRNNHTGTQLSSTISDFTTAAITAVVSESITNGVLDKSPSENIVHDKLLLKQNLPTGYVAGLTLSIHPTDNTKAIIDVGGYIITDFTDVFNVQAIPVEVLVPIEFTPAYLLTNPSTYVALDINKNIISSVTPFDNDDRRVLCIIGNVVHSNLTNINVVNEIKAPILAPTNQLHDLIKAVGFLNLEGNTISANGANLSLNKTAGLIWGLGINANNYTDPHRLVLPEQTSLTFRYRLSVSPIVEFANTTLLDPTQYESSPGVLSPLSNNNRWSVQHLNIFQSGIARVQPAQHEHISFIDARNAAFTESFITESNISENAIFRCYIIMKKTCTDLFADIASGDAEIIHVGKFGNAVGGSNAALTLANILAVLGYTPENVDNKQNSLATDGTGIKYPTVDAVKATTDYNTINSSYNLNQTHQTKYRLYEAQKLMLNPPVLATPVQDGASTIPSAVLVNARVVGVPTALNPQFSFYDGDIRRADYVVSTNTYSGVFPDFEYVKNVAVTTTNSFGNLTVEFMFDGTTIELIEKGQGGRLKISIDEGKGYQTIGNLTIAGGASNGSKYLRKITFPGKTLRKIKVQYEGIYFGGAYIGPNDNLSAVVRRVGKRAVFLGDSFTEGTGGNSVFNNYASICSQLLGWECWNSGSGGTGYIATGSVGRVKFQDRVTHDVISYNPDIVVIEGGTNDTTQDQSTLSTAVNLLISTVKTALPSAKIYVLSNFAVQGITTNITNTRNTIKTASASNGVYFIDSVSGATYDTTGALITQETGSWITGIGSVTNIQTTGNASIYTASDTGHPSIEGYRYIGERLAGEIVKLSGIDAFNTVGSATMEFPSILDSNLLHTTGNETKTGVLTISPNVSATSSFARGLIVTPSLTATANSDALIGLDISPTFINGAFTGITNNLIRGAWNTSFFAINDLSPSNTALYAVAPASQTISSYFIRSDASVTGNTSINSPSVSGFVDIRQGNTAKLRVMPTTGNVLIQNGGTFTDSGFRLDVNGTSRFQSTITMSSAPTTSAGTYDFLARNTSTGVVEKIPSASIAILAQTITNGVTTSAPSQDAVFDALALKANLNGAIFTGQVEAPSFKTGGDVSLNSTGTGLVAPNNGGITFYTNHPSTPGWTSNSNITATFYKTTVYTVATLPITGITTGTYATVSDALAPTYMTTVVGGGAVVTPVFYNGTNWVAH